MSSPRYPALPISIPFSPRALCAELPTGAGPGGSAALRDHWHGRDDVSSPPPGAHGEFTGMLLIKAYHAARGDSARTRVLIPDAAHGTNPATAAMAGFEIVTIPSNQDGCVDLEALRAAAGADTAALMLTNPNTLGVFDHQYSGDHPHRPRGGRPAITTTAPTSTR